MQQIDALSIQSLKDDHIMLVLWIFLQMHQYTEVAKVTFSDSDSAPVPNFLIRIWICNFF